MPYNENQLGMMSHAQLLQLRNALPADDPRQRILADYEHQAFAREWTRKDPFIAPASLLFAIPGYTLAKALHLQGARTGPSLDEMAAGYKGVWQGLGFDAPQGSGGGW